jgi:1,4-dihydroxy-2-naphthoate octaprenyltransferase
MIAWILATRPKTLSASVLPVLVGTFLAKSMIGQVDWSLAIFALFCALFIQIGTNLTNDALDFKKGADTTTRLGPIRVTQAGLIPFKHVLWAGFGAFGLAMLCGIPLIREGGWPLFVILTLCIVLSYLYTGGPYPLGYYGLGDLFVFLFYGLVTTLVVFALQTGYVNYPAILAGIQVGCLATALIGIANLRDINEDVLVGKRTLAVRLGLKGARIKITLLSLLPFALSLLWFQWGYSLAAGLPFLVLPLVHQNINALWTTDPSSEYNHFLARSSLAQLLFGILLAIGYGLK